jgi:hypothetical protein
MTRTRRLTPAFLLAVAAVAAPAQFGQNAPSTQPRVLRVTSAADNNSPGALGNHRK